MKWPASFFHVVGKFGRLFSMDIPNQLPYLNAGKTVFLVAVE